MMKVYIIRYIVSDHIIWYIASQTYSATSSPGLWSNVKIECEQNGLKLATFSTTANVDDIIAVCQAPTASQICYVGLW